MKANEGYKGVAPHILKFAFLHRISRRSEFPELI